MAKNDSVQAESCEVEAVVQGDDLTAKREHEHLEAIKDAEKRVADRESEWESAKTEASDAKKRYDAAVLRLRDVITSQTQPELPFGDPEQQAPEPWRAVDIEELDIPNPVMIALGEVEIATIGQLADWTATKRLTDIKGIGIAKAEQIERAMENFWAAHPEYTKPEAHEEVDESDAVEPDEDDTEAE